jgi:hypothetical protein
MILSVAQICSAQKFIEINNDEFFGVIIPKEFFSGNPSTIKFFTPSKAEISSVEKAIEDYKGRASGISESKIASKDLTKFARQYFGLDIVGQKTITINLIPKENIPNSKWKSEIVSDSSTITLSYSMSNKQISETNLDE